MNKPIRLSPKHGVNPCISVCFFCGKDKQEIALLGKIDKEDHEAPRRAILDYEPCDECKQAMSRGIAMIGVTTTPNNPGQPPIQKNSEATLYPTGSMVVVTPDAIRRIFAGHPMVEKIIESGRTYADEAVVKHILDEYTKSTGKIPPSHT